MRKFGIICFVVFLVYSALISWYLLVGADTAIPEQYKGTAADPSVFMTEEQLLLSGEYSTIKNLIYFINIPLEWAIFLFVLVFGLAKRFQQWSLDVSRFSGIHTTVFVVLLSLVSGLLTFPLNVYSFRLSRDYGISTQSFSGWFRDYLLSFWIGVIILAVMVWVIYALMKKSRKRWWFYTWLISIPFMLIMMYVQPVVIDPLYNDFYPIKDKQLEEEILTLAERADIPVERVYEVNMSEKSTALNAYVTGIGSNIRIVLWDTTLERLSQAGTLFVMAHEIGHYVLHHLPFLILGTVMMSLVALYIGYRLLEWSIKRFGTQLAIKEPSELATLPILLLIFSLLSFSVSPFTNLISREYEYQADRYAIEMTNDSDAAVDAFQELTIAGLSDVNPPTLVKWFRYTHPPMVERIHHLENYWRERKQTDPVRVE